MQLVIQPHGDVRCVYDEAIDLPVLGQVRITRGSHVEPDDTGHWIAVLPPPAELEGQAPVLRLRRLDFVVPRGAPSPARAHCLG